MNDDVAFVAEIYALNFGGLYLFWINIAAKISMRQLLEKLAVYSLGCISPLIVICIWLKIAGVFPQFWFWTISYAHQYVEIVSFRTGIQNAEFTLKTIFQAAPLLWIIAGSGLLCLCFTKLELKRRVFLAGFLAFSFFAVCPGFYFRYHYFIVLVPAVTLLAGFAVTWSSQWLAKKSSIPLIRHLPFLFAAIACVQSLYADRAIFFSLSPTEACRAVYGSASPSLVSLEIGRYIEENTGKDDRIAVMGSEPQIYFYAHRHSSTGQIYVYPLMEPQPFAVKMQEDMIRDIEQNPPKYLVWVGVATSWLEKTNSNQMIIKSINQYVHQNMQPAGLIQFTGPQSIESVWSDDVTNAIIRSKSFIAIYKQKVSD
jgi:hypothetical protein